MINLVLRLHLSSFFVFQIEESGSTTYCIMALDGLMLREKKRGLTGKK